jgi:hypothetical protein
VSGPVRDVALSLFPEIVAEKATGPILKSVFTGQHNADLIAAVAPLYLTGTVLDVTYGEGNWWTRYRPEQFTFHDLEKVDGVDFRDLPHPDRSFDTVVYDPPYIPAGGAATTAKIATSFRHGFGLSHGRTSAAFDDLVMDGLDECCRVTGTYLLVKCMEFVGSASFRDMPVEMANRARVNGLVVHDRIVHHAGAGPGGHNIFTVKRARRVHSYLTVFIREEKAAR